MGKYNRLQTMIDFYEEQKSGVLHEYLSLSMCNETDGYVIGKYDFKAKEYIFIYDKRTGITGNFRRIDNDLLKTGQKNGESILHGSEDLSLNKLSVGSI